MQENNTLQVYKSIHQLPFYKFIDVSVNGNLAALIISGYTGEDDLPHLQAAWIKISAQFAEAIKDERQTYYLNVYTEVLILQATCHQINISIPCLIAANQRNIWFEEFHQELNKLLNTSFKFSPTDFDQNIELLKRMERRSKGIKLQLDLKQIQLDKLAINEETKRPTIEYYQSILISLSDHAGFCITDSITTFQFCERLRRLNIYIKKQNGYGK